MIDGIRALQCSAEKRACEAGGRHATYVPTVAFARKRVHAAGRVLIATVARTKAPADVHNNDCKLRQRRANYQMSSLVTIAPSMLHTAAHGKYHSCYTECLAHHAGLVERHGYIARGLSGPFMSTWI